jgi:thiol-disulfide isomerase/thioredoxin
MKSKIKKYAKELFSFFLIVIIASNVISYFKSNDLNKEPLPIKKFTLLDGSNYQATNKPLLVYVWATWCPICKFQSPNIQSLSKDYELITIAVQSGDEFSIKNYLKNENYNFKVVNDENGLIASKLKVSVYPTTFIYDKNHNLLFSDIGYTSTLGLYLRMLYANL